MTTSPNRLALFPLSAQINANRLSIAGLDVQTLAKEYGTPLYLYDLAQLEDTAGQYQTTFRQTWQANWSITYAGKAFLTPAIARWAKAHNFVVDCTGAGEMGVAAHAGLGRENILAHGVNKSEEDLQAAIRYAGIIVADNLSELRRLARLRTPGETLPQIWLRLQPGMAVETHSYTQTGHEGSKFGMSEAQIMEAAQFCRQHDLPLTGIHFHQGSQFRDPSPLQPAIEKALDLAQELNLGADWHFSPGGGWGVAYHEEELPHPSVPEYLRFVTSLTQSGCRARNLPLPHLHLEPGRSLVARAGVAVYQVGTVKQAGTHTWLLVDGGMADNPRKALYGAKYSCLAVTQAAEEPQQTVSVAGPYCESGDVLIDEITLPPLQEGEYIAIPVSGAYHLSMASNYNGARRPAALLLEAGKAPQVIQNRETVADLLRGDTVP